MVLFGRLSLIRADGSISSSFPITVKRVTIGSHVDNDIRIHKNNQTIADYHLELIVDDNANGKQGYNCCLNTINGEYVAVNGVKYLAKERACVRDGDKITIGTKTFVYEEVKAVLENKSDAQNDGQHIECNDENMPINRSYSTPKNKCRVADKQHKSTPFSRIPVPVVGFSRRKSYKSAARETPNRFKITPIKVEDNISNVENVSIHKLDAINNCEVSAQTLDNIVEEDIGCNKDADINSKIEEAIESNVEEDLNNSVEGINANSNSEILNNTFTVEEVTESNKQVLPINSTLEFINLEIEINNECNKECIEANNEQVFNYNDECIYTNSYAEILNTISEENEDNKEDEINSNMDSMNSDFDLVIDISKESIDSNIEDLLNYNVKDITPNKFKIMPINVEEVEDVISNAENVNLNKLDTTNNCEKDIKCNKEADIDSKIEDVMNSDLGLDIIGYNEEAIESNVEEDLNNSVEEEIECNKEADVNSKIEEVINYNVEAIESNFEEVLNYNDKCIYANSYEEILNTIAEEIEDNKEDEINSNMDSMNSDFDLVIDTSKESIDSNIENVLNYNVKDVDTNSNAEKLNNTFVFEDDVVDSNEKVIDSITEEVVKSESEMVIDICNISNDEESIKLKKELVILDERLSTPKQDNSNDYLSPARTLALRSLSKKSKPIESTINATPVTRSVIKKSQPNEITINTTPATRSVTKKSKPNEITINTTPATRSVTKKSKPNESSINTIDNMVEECSKETDIDSKNDEVMNSDLGLVIDCNEEAIESNVEENLNNSVEGDIVDSNEKVIDSITEEVVKSDSEMVIDICKELNDSDKECIKTITENVLNFKVKDIDDNSNERLLNNTIVIEDDSDDSKENNTIVVEDDIDDSKEKGLNSITEEVSDSEIDVDTSKEPDNSIIEVVKSNVEESKKLKKELVVLVERLSTPIQEESGNDYLSSARTYALRSRSKKAKPIEITDNDTPVTRSVTKKSKPSEITNKDTPVTRLVTKKSKLNEGAINCDTSGPQWIRAGAMWKCSKCESCFKGKGSHAAKCWV